MIPKEIDDITKSDIDALVSGNIQESITLEYKEQLDFENAVKAVIHWVRTTSSWRETLLVITSDHETGYLTGPGSDPTWEPIVNNGAGNLPGMEWQSHSHTNSLVPLYARGRGARKLQQYADENDPVHGPYVDNTELAMVIFRAIDPQ